MQPASAASDKPGQMQSQGNTQPTHTKGGTPSSETDNRRGELGRQEASESDSTLLTAGIDGTTCERRHQARRLERQQSRRSGVTAYVTISKKDKDMQKREVWLVLYRVGGVIKRTAPFETEEE